MSIPWNSECYGYASVFDKLNQYGACGSYLDTSSSTYFASISKEWFFNSDTEKSDNYCAESVCVKVTYNSKDVLVPIKDQCGNCGKCDLQLSRLALKRLDIHTDNIYGLKWTFVHC